MNSTLFKKNKRWLILFAAPAIILFCVIIVIPLFQTLYYSFFEWNGIKVAAFKGIENYKKLLHSREINTSFINSIVYAVFLVVYQVGFGTAFAFILTQSEMDIVVCRSICRVLEGYGLYHADYLCRRKKYPGNL